MKKQNKTSDISCESTVGDRVIAGVNNELKAKPYEAPVLVSYGDVRDITLGGTLGMGESGSGFQNFDVIRP